MHTSTASQALHVIDHPLVAHLLAQARDGRTSCHVFRQLLRQIGMLLGYEATRDLATTPRNVHTPLEPCQGRSVAGPITIVAILRAGIGMAEGIADLLPFASIGHLGMYRDEQKLEPIHYYNNIPANAADGPVLLVDPMLATGGSAAAAVEFLRDRGCRDVRLICLVAAPEGVARLQRLDATLPIYAAALDRQLNERGYILPGLGDAGDRLFGTGTSLEHGA